MTSFAKKFVLWFPVLLPLYVLRLKIGPLPSTVLEIAFIAAIVLATATSGWHIWKTGLQRTRPWHLPAGLWIIATVIAVFVAPHAVSAFGLWRAYVLEPMAYALLLAAYLDSEEDRTALIRAFIVSAVIVAAIAIVQFTTGRWIPHPWDTGLLTRRATGPFPFPNALSLFSVPIAAFCFGLLISSLKNQTSLSPLIRKERGLYFLGFGAALLSTLLAKSVGGFVGICAAVFFGLVSWKKTRLYSIAAVALVIVTIVAIPTLRKPVVSTLSFKQWSGEVRTIIWKETINMLKDHPITGAGFGAYPDVIKPYHKATYLEIFQYPHDILLNLWSETGLLGMFAFGWICFVWFKSSVRKAGGSVRAYMALPLIAILIHGLVDVPYFKNDLAFQFWMLAILV